MFVKPRKLWFNPKFIFMRRCKDVWEFPILTSYSFESKEKANTCILCSILKLPEYCSNIAT